MRKAIWGLVSMLIMIFVFGWYAFVIVGAIASIIGLILWKKPEWEDKLLGK